MPTAKYLNWTHPRMGHAALCINLEHFRNTPMSVDLGGLNVGMDGLNHYVSWFSQGGNLLQGKGVAQTFVDDFAHFGRAPDRSVEIPNLDTEAMFAEWYEMRNKDGAHWKMFDKNCATVVVRVLKAGGADQYCPARYKRKQLIWTPQQAYVYAESVGRHAAALN